MGERVNEQCAKEGHERISRDYTYNVHVVCARCGARWIPDVQTSSGGFWVLPLAERERSGT
jgi:hypothetical protein